MRWAWPISLCLYIVPMFILYSMGDFKSLTINNTITASAYVYIIGEIIKGLVIQNLLKIFYKNK